MITASINSSRLSFRVGIFNSANILLGLAAALSIYIAAGDVFVNESVCRETCFAASILTVAVRCFRMLAFRIPSIVIDEDNLTVVTEFGEYVFDRRTVAYEISTSRLRHTRIIIADNESRAVLSGFQYGKKAVEGVAEIIRSV